MGLLAACSPPREVAVEERDTINRAEERERLGGAHIRIVVPGDTLYGIAFANGLDVHALAAWNQLDDTSKLKVGQRIRLTRPVGFVAALKTTVEPIIVQPESGQSGSNQSEQERRPATTVHVQDSSVPAISDSSSKRNASWRWPTKGKIVQRFNQSQGEQGIDIAGLEGQAIVAARDGEVVYVGNGLKGYGNLIILKHNELFLSAYAHNQETFVAENEKVLVGKRIATMGRDRQKVVLHFQIRRDGDPVNPLAYLPKQKSNEN